jgi:MGT family glycosyltransferase
LEIKGSGIPPAFSGYPSDDPSGWARFTAEYDRVHRPLWTEFNQWVRDQGAPPLPELEFIHHGDLNLYVYPEFADYVAARPLDERWVRLDSSVRETDESFTLPPELAGREGALIYFSLGSLGSADVELMRRVVDALGRTRHRYIVSKGPQHDLFELAPNMAGAEFLPQTSILPQVDVVITHGGNNTVTESLSFGKPMVVLPLFWDQYDNAQRVDELGYGVRLDPYRFTDAQLYQSIDSLLGNRELTASLAGIGADIRARDGLRVAADAIERLAR